MDEDDGGRKGEDMKEVFREFKWEREVEVEAWKKVSFFWLGYRIDFPRHSLSHHFTLLVAMVN